MSRPSRDYDTMSLDDFEEFLADKPKNERWELIGGRVVKMMVGARWEHGRIVQNIARALDNRFEAAQSSCQSFAETLFVKESRHDSALLPDVVVVCGDPEPGATSVSDPVVLFEVLSPGTEGRDRLEKWHIYQRLLSLKHYVLVSRDKPHVEVFDRVGEAWSGLRVLSGIDAVLDLPAVSIRFPLSEIYRRALRT